MPLPQPLDFTEPASGCFWATCTITPASEDGGTAKYASRLIGEREVVRLVRSVSRSSGPNFGTNRDTEGHAEQTATESAVMAAEIEQLPVRTGFLKFASQPGWMRLGFPIYELPKVAAPFVPS